MITIMNKISAFFIGALSVGMVACDDFEMPNPPAQSNPQEPAIEVSTLRMTPYLGADDIVNLIAVDEEGGQVALARVDSIANFPAGYEFGFTVQVSATSEFTKVANVPATVVDSVVYVNPDDLTAGFREAWTTMSPQTRPLNIRFAAYAVKGESRVRLGGTDVYYCPETATVMPLLPGFTVEEVYYLIGTPTAGTIDDQKAIMMANNGGDPYDNPEFACEVYITDDEAAAGYQWAIVSRSTLMEGSGVVLAPAESTSEAEGGLVDSESTGNWVSINEPGSYLVKFNAIADEKGEYAYTYELLARLYTPGNGNGWSQTASQVLTTSDNVNFSGFVYSGGEFKFTSAPDWDHTNYGYAEEGKLSTDGGAGNITTVAGLYWADVNVVDLTYSLGGPLTELGLRGDATEGGWEVTTPLTPSDDYLVWTGTVKFNGSGKFKLLFNDNWDICNLGGNLSDLTFKGADMPTPGEGTYDVVVDLSVRPYEMSVVKK